MPLTLIPLTLYDHTDLLQAVYVAAPAYWRRFGLDAAPEFQAIQTLRAANDTPGRALFGILHPDRGTGVRGLGGRGPGGYPATDAPATDAPATDAPTTNAPTTNAPATDAPTTDASPLTPSPLPPVMIGVIDIQMHAPARGVTTVGMIMVAEPWQRQGHGSAAWALVEAWLAGAAGMTKVRTAIEAFNPGALRFFTAQGFAVLPEATRTQVGEHLVRQIFAEKTLRHREESSEESHAESHEE